jgi:predicted nucleotidyltransferase
MADETARFGLDERTLARIKAVLARFPDIEAALIYGSRAKGNFRPGSDIDLALKGSCLSDGALLRVERALDDLDLPYRMDVSLYASLENPQLRAHIERVGVAL